MEVAVRAVWIRSFGPPEVLEATTLSDPTPGDGEVLVAVAAAGVNFADTMARSGRAPAGRRPALPAVLGSEVGGEVVAVGSGVEAPTVGATIVAGTGGLGGYAQLAIVSAAAAVPVPVGLAVEDAVAVFVHGRTALALVRRARVTQADRVLVLAAAGGVGSMLVQLAAAEGAHVTGVASDERKTEAARQLGASVVVDAGDPTWPEHVRAAVGEVDVVFDGVGGDAGRAALDLLAPRGRMVIFGYSSGSITQAATDEVLSRALTIVGFGGGQQFNGSAEPRVLAIEVLQMAAGRRARPLVGQRFRLQDAAAAHRLLEARGSVGKTLLVPQARS
jgi:NADPH2:quinone reductase